MGGSHRLTPNAIYTTVWFTGVGHGAPRWGYKTSDRGRTWTRLLTSAFREIVITDIAVSLGRFVREGAVGPSVEG